MKSEDTKNDLISALDSEDDLGKVIRSHLIIENLLITIIESNVKDVKYLNKIDLTFEQKTNLALSFGIDNKFAMPLACLGTIRNSFAHKARGGINKSDANNFYKSFSPRDKAAMRNLYIKNEESLKKQGYPPYSKLEPIHKFSLCVTVLAGALQAWVNVHSKKA